MRIAYLVNLYPKTSHSFVRREIEGVERAGLQVTRYSIRVVDEPLVDARDVAERERTTVVLDGGAWNLLAATIGVALSRPWRFVCAVALALRLGWRSNRGELVHLAYVAEASLLLRRVTRAGVDHVHAHFATNPASVALLCHALGGPPYSFTFHGPEFFEFRTHAALGLRIARARFVVAISHHGRSQLMRMTEREHWPRIVLVHCGVDATFLECAPTPVPDAARFVCVARIDRAKGHFVLVEAAALLAAEGRAFEIVLVGDGELRPDIEAAVHARGLERHLRFVGWKSGVEVADEIRASRALVLPSFEEGLPVVFMEALALERPVVSTYIAGIPELVLPGECGWLVPAGSAEHLADALREALDASPAELQAMGRRGSALVREHHDSEREARRMAELFRHSAVTVPSNTLESHVAPA